jgi:hypothetical protein
MTWWQHAIALWILLNVAVLAWKLHLDGTR